MPKTLRKNGNQMPPRGRQMRRRALFITGCCATFTPVPRRSPQRIQHTEILIAHTQRAKIKLRQRRYAHIRQQAQSYSHTAATFTVGDNLTFCNNMKPPPNKAHAYPNRHQSRGQALEPNQRNDEAVQRHYNSTAMHTSISICCRRQFPHRRQ